jgi:hypothetical protein
MDSIEWGRCIIHSPNAEWILDKHGEIKQALNWKKKNILERTIYGVTDHNNTR